MRPIEMRLLFYLLSALQYMFSSFLLSRVRTCNHILLAFPMQCDVNTVCFADETGHLIYSGSDDSLCKVKFIPVPCRELDHLLLQCMSGCFLE
uniref:Uncharacterized protein MANES_03G189300 n=1 Tax=Rhizophora mucronata TaxID=61149 RepID=A0A2P2LTJ7_RHIMU